MISFEDLFAGDDEPRPLVDGEPGTGSHHDHVLVIETWEGYDPEWEVLHPPSCYPTAFLGDEDHPGPDHRCGLHYELAQAGDDAFDIVSQQQTMWPERLTIAGLLPAGRYLCRWYVEPGTARSYWSGPDDDRSGIEIVPGPVWDGDREGWT